MLETNIHPWLFCQGNVTYCSWNTECLRMSFSLPWLCLFHTSCPVYQCGRPWSVCVFIPHPFPLSCSLIQSYWDQLNMLLTPIQYNQILRRCGVSGTGPIRLERVCECVCVWVFFLRLVWCLSMFSHVRAIYKCLNASSLSPCVFKLKN